MRHLVFVDSFHEIKCVRQGRMVCSGQMACFVKREREKERETVWQWKNYMKYRPGFYSIIVPVHCKA